MGRWRSKLNSILKERDIGAAVKEIYTPIRANGVAEKLGLIQGMSLDLTTTDGNGDPWDFNVKRVKDKPEKILRNKGRIIVNRKPYGHAIQPASDRQLQ